MKAWVRTAGKVATVGMLAPVALLATWIAVDASLWNAKPGDGADQHAQTGLAMAGDGLLLRRAVSSTRIGAPSGQPPVPAASGKLTLAAFEGRGLLDPTRILFVENGGVPGLVVLASADDPGNGQAFGLFRSENANGLHTASARGPGGSSLGSLMRGAGLTAGPGGGGSAIFPPAVLQQLQAAGALGDPGVGNSGGIPGFGGYEVTLEITPLPPAILAFLSGLAALFVFRRTRGRAAEPAAH